MPEHTPIEPGATVEATDGHFGQVEELIVRPSTGELAYLLVRHAAGTTTIPASFIADVVSPREVRLRMTREVARSRAAGSTRIPDGSSQIRTPVYEERLHVETRPVGLGEVRLRKHVEHVEEVFRGPVTRDDLEIQRVRVDRPIDGPVEPRHEDGWYVVPVMEEVLVVSKRLMLAEEVRIRTRQVVEEQEVRETARRERIEVEDATVYGARDVGATTHGLREDHAPSRDDRAPSRDDRAPSRDQRATVRDGAAPAGGTAPDAAAFRRREP